MFLKVLALIYVGCFIANAWSNRQKAKWLRVIAKAFQEESNA